MTKLVVVGVLTKKKVNDILADHRMDLTPNEHELLNQIVVLQREIGRYEFEEEEHKVQEKDKAHFDEIYAAHPLTTGDYALYEEATELVSQRFGKYELIDLVNWLLFKFKKVTISRTGIEAIPVIEH